MNNKIFKGAFILAVGAFLTKIIGAIYRIPLTNLLGEKGLGLYQMAFPAYVALLDLSSAGVPSALAKNIAKYPEKAKLYLKKSLLIFSILGGVSSVLLFSLSTPLAIFCGDITAKYAFMALSPAVVVVALISCFRGYFQGKFLMYPTALSQIIEQGVKVLVGILLVIKANTLISKLIGATIAVFIGEFFALLFLVLVYLIKNKRVRDSAFFVFDNSFSAKSLLKETSVIMLLAIIFPLSQVIDSSLIIGGLGKGERAVSLFGLFSGASLTIANLPISLLHGLCAVAIPTLSKKGKNKNTQKLLISFTFFSSLILAFLTFVLAPIGVRIIFPSLIESNKILVIKLLRSLSFYIVICSLYHISSSILIAKGKTKISLINSIFGVIVKLVLLYLLVKIPSLSIFGAVIALTSCYFVACFLNLLYIKIYGNKEDYSRQLNSKHQRLFSADGRVYRLRVPFHLRRFGRGRYLH